MQQDPAITTADYLARSLFLVGWPTLVACVVIGLSLLAGYTIYRAYLK